MDWSKIKTIFIISFLILDIYLLYQYKLIRDANQYKFLSEVSLTDKLKTDEIDMIELSNEVVHDRYLSAKPKEFTHDEFSFLKEQSITIMDGTLVVGELTNPVPLSSNFDPLEAQSFLNSYVLFGDQYGFWNIDVEHKTITFYQKHDQKMFYENMNGKVVLYLNNLFQIESYHQTYLGEVENLTEKEEVLPATKAIETLYQKGVLKPKSKITKVELGYSTLVQLAASQVLTPTWHVVVGDQTDLYVNAFEGQIIQFNSEESSKVE
ncbi:two-component system regulatory protein YycI [Pseudoneobacillus sp. C159]